MLAAPDLQPLLDPSAMRLAMGELTGQELALAQEAIGLAFASLDTQGWSAVPIEPAPALLMSIAIRLDHGLGVPGYYDGLKASYEHMGLPQPVSALPTHEQRLNETLETARKAHAQLLEHAQPWKLPGFEGLVTALQGTIAAQFDALEGEDALVVASAVRYGLANLSRYGYRLLPHEPTPPMLDAAARVLKASDADGTAPSSEFAARAQQVCMADAHRIHEEIVGLGFYHPVPVSARHATRSPR